MAIDLWLKDSDKDILLGVFNIELTEYPLAEGILTGTLDDKVVTKRGKSDPTGIMSGIGKRFVLGRKEIWIPKDFNDHEHGSPFVYIKNSRAYTDGLILTPYDYHDVVYHLKTEPIEKRVKAHVQQLYGSDADDFVWRVFRTYGDSLILKKIIEPDGKRIKEPNERDLHLVLYSVRK